MSRRRSIGNLSISGVSPKENFNKKDLDELKTVGLKLTKDEVVELINLLKAAMDTSNNWNYLNITGYRSTRQLTVSYYNPV